MQVAIPFTEALALATAREPLPPLVRSLSAQGSVVHAEIDLHHIPNAPPALRFVASAVGTVALTARLTGYEEGVVTIAVTAHARALPAHKLLGYLSGPIEDALRRQGLPPRLVEVRRGEGDPVLVVHVQDAVDTKASGVTVTGLGLTDETIYAAVTLGTVRLR